jgi:transcriptional regulator with XRE-family HTH domain
MFQITLEAARVNAGYSQKEAAQKLGVSNCTLLHWEKGVSMPKANQITAICELYGIPYDMLIFLPNRLAKS